ncbi:MAG: BamA/TamA family outer membrane protein [Deltaproteobacteria bacterium]|nr:BamA/TamA family outer membrane protein [Deltaproteobacteria bacterium]
MSGGRHKAMRLAVALVAVLGSEARAQPHRLHGQTVLSVRLEGPGLTQQEGMGYIEVHPGDRFQIESVRRSVKLLYHLGLFGQVRVTARQVPGGLELDFVCIPKKIVLSVEFLGASAVDEVELSRLSRLERGEEYDHWKMESTAADIRQLYRKRGYRKTRVIARAEEVSGDVQVRFFIQEGEPTRISRLVFVGQEVFSSKRLSEEMEIGQGDILDVERIRAGRERLVGFLHREGYLEASVSEPEIDLESDALAEVIALTVHPGRRVRLAFEGNQVIQSAALEDALGADEGLRLDGSGVRELCERIGDLYRQRGFARVEVRASVEIDRVRRAELVTFQIEEGPRVTVRRIDFEGNAEFSDRELVGYIHNAMLDAIPQSLLGQPVDRGDVDVFAGGHPIRGRPRRVNRPQGFLFEIVPETVFLQKPYREAIGAIEDLYRSRGYLQVRIGSPILYYDASGANLRVAIPIEEGPQTRVESISFEGNEAVEARELLRVAEEAARFIKAGEPLDPYGVEVLRKELTRFYANRGYAYCRVERSLVYSADRTLAGVLFSFSEGPQVRVRRVLVRGNVVTAREIFDHLVALRPGEIVSPGRMSDTQDALLDLGVFSSVEIKLVDPDVPEAQKNVVVSVRERLEHQLVFGPGISSGEGVRLVVEYTHRNLFGYGLEFVSKAKLNYQVFYPLLQSSLKRRYEEMPFLEGLEGWLFAGVHWPRIWFWEREVAGRIDVLALQDHAISYDLTKVSLTPGFDLKLTSQLTLKLEYEFEYNSLTCPFGEEEVLCPEGSGMRCGEARRRLPVSPCGGATSEQRWLRYDEGSLLIGSLRPELRWDRRDNPFNPHSGILVTFRSELASSFMPDKEVLFVKLDGQVSGYLPLGRALTLALSLRSGAIMHLTADSRTPSHKLFFLGGRNTIRSYNEEALIPSDLDPPCIVTRTGRQGEVVCVSPGGNAYLTLKAEFRFPLVPDRIDGALFADFGNLWVEPANYNPIDLRPAAGVGVRLVTPIGPVAFDLGVNLDPDDARAEDRWNLHFNIGVF